YARALLRTLAHFGRVGAEKRRRARRHPGPDHIEADREVMALEAPAPRLLVAWRAEDRQEVGLMVARHALTALDGTEDLLELHDRRRRQVAARAEAGLEQVVRE